MLIPNHFQLITVKNIPEAFLYLLSTFRFLINSIVVKYNSGFTTPVLDKLVYVLIQ